MCECRRRPLPLALFIWVGCIQLALAQAPVNETDCVTARYITGVWVNTQGNEIVYEVKIPNACKTMDVQCVSTWEMLAREKVRFELNEEK